MNSILIVGASGGIGRVVAYHFLSKGYLVFGTNYRNAFSSRLLKNSNFKGLSLDLRDVSQVEGLKSQLPKLDAIINCAGIVEFEAYSDPSGNLDIWHRTIEVNMTGSYLLFEKLREKIRHAGSYIMMSSTDSYFGGKVNTAYAASKSGVNTLTKSLALMYQESKIRVNAIAPGWVETAMMEASGDELVEYAKQINPLRRNGNPQDVANLVEFLVSEKAGYINGHVITLDGGYTLQDPTLMFEEKNLSK